MERRVKIGCYSAFWGDTVTAARQLVEAEDAQLDYLVADYLAEVTMGLLARSYRFVAESRAAPKPVGYIKEFLTLVLKPLLPKILDKKITVITNAGGLDPVGLKELIEDYAAEVGESDRVRVAAVYGDDLLMNKEELITSGAFERFDPLNGLGVPEESFGAGEGLLSLNAYIGAEPITRALQHGANIVVTGRCVDSAAVVAPLAFEYGWDFSRLDDQVTLDRLASASLAGHILECGAQATGGNFTDWILSAGSSHGGWANMGYPIATFQSDGNFTVSKPEKTGGLVTRHTVGEQMLYEVLDPENYILPDVVLDLSTVELSQVSKDVVLVAGAKGKPPTPWLKCTAVKQTGYRTTADLLIFGAEAEAKGQALGKAILQRFRNVAKAELGDEDGALEIPESDTNVTVIGAELSLGSTEARKGVREVVLKISAKHAKPAVLNILGREIASFGTSSAPGIATLSSGRPKVTPNISTSSVLVQRRAVTPTVVVGGRGSAPLQVPLADQGCTMVAASPRAVSVVAGKVPISENISNIGTISLIDVAVGRSGDKGDSANVAIIARNAQFYPYIYEQVTPQRICHALRHFLKDDSIITRYDIPGIHAVNFVLTKALGGGGLESLALDKQGKGYAQICLASIRVEVPLEAIAEVKL